MFLIDLDFHLKCRCIALIRQVVSDLGENPAFTIDRGFETLSSCRLLWVDIWLADGQRQAEFCDAALNAFPFRLCRPLGI